MEAFKVRKAQRGALTRQRVGEQAGVTGDGTVVVGADLGSELEDLGARQLGRHGQRVTPPPRQLPPVVRRRLLAPRGPVSRRPVAERAPRRRVEVKHQREDGRARHVEELDLAAAQVLSGGEGVDLAGLGGPLGDGGVVVGVLDVHFLPRFAREDVRLAAAEPDVSSGARRLGRDFIILETERVQALEALDLLAWDQETDAA